ncbi:MAG: hypothetical protein QNJ35_03325 [Paracoccaceae bacterium]|nr:hypothetical protein [Paracoccaceae bacterium]
MNTICIDAIMGRHFHEFTRLGRLRDHVVEINAATQDKGACFRVSQSSGTCSGGAAEWRLSVA